MSAAAAVLFWMVVLPAAPVRTTAIDVSTLLKQVGLQAGDVQKIERGDVVGRTTDADSSAVALVVAGRVAVPPTYYLERLRVIESFKKSPEILQIGRVGVPPAPSQFVNLTLDNADVDDLRGCRVQDCGLKLSAEAITRLARRDAQALTASAAMREFLADYAGKYLQAGNASLIEYNDGSRPKRLADELRVITPHFGYLQRGWPTLHDAIAGFAGTLPDGIEHFLYWSKEKIGPRAVVSMTHVLISPLRDGTAAAASKQIYASHYSNASVGLTLLIDQGTEAAPRTLVIYVNRSRLDIFDGLFAGIKRPLVRSRARDGAERTMRRLRDRLEADYKTTRQ